MASRVRPQVGHNTAKLRALEALARDPRRWWTAEEWSRSAHIVPKRRMYTYALRLAEYDLVDRGLMDGHLVYRITPVGLERLAWLRTTLPRERENPAIRILSRIGL
jgi:hypothetical protein